MTRFLRLARVGLGRRVTGTGTDIGTLGTAAIGNVSVRAIDGSRTTGRSMAIAGRLSAAAGTAASQNAIPMDGGPDSRSSVLFALAGARVTRGRVASAAA